MSTRAGSGGKRAWATSLGLRPAAVRGPGFHAVRVFAHAVPSLCPDHFLQFSQLLPGPLRGHPKQPHCDQQRLSQRGMQSGESLLTNLLITMPSLLDSQFQRSRSFVCLVLGYGALRAEISVQDVVGAPERLQQWEERMASQSSHALF